VATADSIRLCLFGQSVSRPARGSELTGRRHRSLRNCPEISSLFDPKPQAMVFQTPARIQNTIACGFGSNKATEIGNLFRD